MSDQPQIRDQRFESLFDRWNLKFEYIPELNLSDDLKVLDEVQVRDLANIAPPARVDEYEQQMRNGAKHPPIVVAAQLRGETDVLIDGNTRALAARRVGRDTFPAYRVSPIPDEKFSLILAAALNQLGGDRLAAVEAHKAALVAMDMGLKDEQIARELGYSAESVRRWRRDQQFGERIDRLKMTDAAEKLNKTQKRALSQIEHDGPFAELLSLTAETKPDKQEFKELVETIKTATSDDAALEIIGKAREEWTPIGPPPSKVYRNPVASQARMHIGGLLKIDDPAAVYDPSKADEDIVKWRQLRDVIECVIAVFEAK
jgi:ParB-like chromosome segregation protein Spo0J